ncbi:hypothetical protein Ahy_B02g058334 [Arachis hypogaea]|uniref:Uncharacterized protein n=1 Tax=Arachis hypogaea TaxID=3818 RepID=A0A445AEF5_ARAHY|nr:hypothetical protein Ahy_B02g058334 [Arachis hypogaea]
MNSRPENYVHAWLTMGSYNEIYEYHINPIRGQELWETSQYLYCLSPVRSKPCGRPSHYARKKYAHEAPVRGSQERTTRKLKRKYSKFTYAANKSDAGAKSKEGEVVSAEGKAGAEGGQTEIQIEAAKTTKNVKKGLPRTKSKKHNKLPIKRTTASTDATIAAAPHPTEILRETVQGASAVTSEKLASFLKFVPTPGFNPLRKSV